MTHKNLYGSLEDEEALKQVIHAEIRFFLKKEKIFIIFIYKIIYLLFIMFTIYIFYYIYTLKQNNLTENDKDFTFDL